MPYAQIEGWGMHLPSRIVPNESFVKMGLDTSDEWISSRTGIEERRLAGHNEATSDMAVKAAHRALRVAEAHASDVDLIIVATCTPDHIMPSTASLVQNRLGARRAGALDLNAACAGFVYALAMGAGQIEAGRAGRVLVIGADELSLHLDWRDRSTCVLFGDGAGRVDEGDNIVLTSFGAGLSWAALALRWTVPIEGHPSRWTPIRQTFESRMAAVRSAMRRQQRRVRASLDERFRADGG